MPNITVSEDVHSLLQAADNAAVRDSIELGASDTVEFGAFVPPAGTTAEIDAVTSAEIGSVMWDTDKSHYVRFDTASTYITLVGGEKLYLNKPDVGATDYFTLPQSWGTGGIIANQPLVTSAAVTVKNKGWHRVTMKGTIGGLSAPTTSGNITASVSGSSQIMSIDCKASQYSPIPAVTSMLSAIVTPRSSYAFDFTDAFFSMMSTASSVSFELSIDVYNDDGTEDVITYTYDSPILYTVPVVVNSIESKLIG